MYILQEGITFSFLVYSPIYLILTDNKHLHQIPFTVTV